MNEELKQHALRIAEILQEQGNPYQRIEIDQDGLKTVSINVLAPSDEQADGKIILQIGKESVKKAQKLIDEYHAAFKKANSLADELAQLKVSLKQGN